MKNLILQILIPVVLIIGSSAVLRAQANQKIITQINELRAEIVESSRQGDSKTLAALYADDFTHTHASGQVDDKTKRIAALVSGTKTIELVEAQELKTRVYGTNTAVVTGKSEIDGKRFRWTITYFKTGKNWRVVASQATQIAEN